MLGLFSSAVVSPPEDLVAAGNRTPSPKTTASVLLEQFLKHNNWSVSVQIGDHAYLAYSHHNQSPIHPSFELRQDEIFCLFEGVLHNLGRLRQEYGLAKSAKEEVLVIDVYRALRDRSPYPASRVVGHLLGDFGFLLFDHSTSTLFVTSDQQGKVALYWGITADGFVAFADDADLLKGACGKSLASFPPGCFFSTAVGKLQSYNNPKSKIIAVPGAEEEICGATFKVEVDATG